MKTRIYFAAALAIFAFAACNKDDVPQGPKEEPKSTACRITKVVVTSGSSSRECNIYEKEKTVDVLDIAGYDLSALKFDIEISEKATSNFDASQTYDCSNLENPLVVRVTAEDTTKFQDYTFVVRIPELAFDCTPVDDWTAGELGITIDVNASVSGGVAFAGTDKFVSLSGQIFKLDGTPAGTLNREGVCGETFINISNDVNGVVIAASEAPEQAYGEFYAWIDGTDQAPTVIYSNKPAPGDENQTPGTPCRYASCGGDVKGDFLLTAITGGRGATTMHHLFEFHNGDFANPTWHAFSTEYASNDGNWGQMVSPTSGNVNGWYVIGDSNGSNHGQWIISREGWEDNFEDNMLFGTTVPDKLDMMGGDSDNHWYGNYSTGHVRGFQFQGIDYVVATTTGWPCTYITVQGMVPVWLEGEDDLGETYKYMEPSHYLMRTQILEGSQVTPSSSYIYDEANECGYIITWTGVHMYLYKISGEIL